MRKTLLLLLPISCFLLNAESTFSQNDEKSTTIGNPGIRESAMNICADAAGNKYIGGLTAQKGLVVKQNAANVIQWSKSIAFTNFPNDGVNISFLDLIGDTVFGCGNILEPLSSLEKGCFYFKMNAQTGALYWSEFEASGQNYLSCMRYANGKFFLVGGTNTSVTNSSGRVLAVSSQTGQVIWQNSGIRGSISGSFVDSKTSFLSATEVVNGQLFIAGSVVNMNGVTTALPLLIGMDENGIVFLRKYINVPGALMGQDEYGIPRIEFDQDQNLVMIVSDFIYGNTLDPFFLKCDTLGNLIFARRYGLIAPSNKFLLEINETATHYVLYGLSISGGQKLYAVKILKNGTLNKSVSISKPNVNYYPSIGANYGTGNSTFINGLHYFPTVESATSVINQDINQIILDEDLNVVGDCSEINLLPYFQMNVPVTFMQMPVNVVPIPLTFSNGIIIQDEPFNDPCIGTSLELVQTGCQTATLTANATGFTDPTFYWSNGISGDSSSISVNTTDTVIVRLLDTKCCELIDTIVPVLGNPSLVVSLSADTSVCLQPGDSFILSPVVSGAVSVPDYLWNDQSTGSTLSVASSGTYWVSVSDNCSTQTDSFTLVLNYFPELDLPTYLDTCFDIGVGFSYTAQGSPGLYQWSSGSQTATEWILQEGIYSITLTNQCGSVTDSMQVRRLTEVGLYFPEDSILVCEKQLSVSNLQVETNYTLEIFTPTGDLVGAHLWESGWYLIHAFNACNEKWDSIYVNLQNEQFFYLPNSFTPNGDGNNELFEFKGENIVIRDVHIFNRWGEEVFSESGSFTGWDGKYRGEICPDGIYAVQLIYEDCFGLPAEFNGHVNLVR
ncbi:MAG: gliding motility-associated C-terminal domain-containing protein [Fluviicola sp.]